MNPQVRKIQLNNLTHIYLFVIINIAMAMSDKVPPKDFLNALEHQQTRNSKKGMKRFLFWLLVFFCIAGLSGTYYFYAKYRTLSQDPTITSQKDLDATLAAVGALMVLPTDEVPTMATILDKDKLSDQAFFAQAQNGDKLLAYTTSMQAILYRPSTNKIIKVAPIYVDTAAIEETTGNAVGEEELPEDDVPEEVPQSVRIAYYNGSEIPNLSALTEQTVKELYPEYETTLMQDTTMSDYTDTLVINLSGDHSAEVAALAAALGASVGTLPEGEVAPDADILIISAK